jgi:phenylacetate-CoA ligase
MTTYEDLRQRHLAYWTSIISEHVGRLGWPVERLQRERDERLRSLLRVAQGKSSWHRKRLRRVDPDTVREEDLQRLEPMTKDDLMAHWDEIVTDSHLTLGMAESHLAGLRSDAYLIDEVHVVASGGSTGRRGVFVFGWEAWATAWAGFLRATVWDRSVSPVIGRAPNTIAMVAAQHATHMTAAMGQTFANRMTQTTLVPITQPVAAIVARLNQVQPTILLGYATALALLAAEARAGHLQIAPQRIISTGEPLLPESRQVLEQTFQAPVANVYGTSDAGPIAAGCWRSPGMHLGDDLVIIEPVDQAGGAVVSGTLSDKIYVTAISNPTLPLIRFELTDQVRFLEGPCSCGSSHRRIADVEGRLDDAFLYEGIVVVHPHVFRSMLGRERSIVEYQVRQTEKGADILTVGAPGDRIGFEHGLRQRCRALASRARRSAYRLWSDWTVSRQARSVGLSQLQHRKHLQWRDAVTTSKRAGTDPPGCAGGSM